MRSAKACAIGLLSAVLLWPIDAGTAPWAVLMPQDKPDFSAVNITLPQGEAFSLAPNPRQKPVLARDFVSDQELVQIKSPYFSKALQMWQVGVYDAALEMFGQITHDKDQVRGARVRAAVWAARSAKKLDQTKVAQAYLEKAIKIAPTHFYGQLAAQILDKDIAINKASYPILDQDLKQNAKADIALVHAIIKQESRFNPKASSSAGARGLMQIMPVTARHVDKAGYRSSDQLFDKAYNVRLGSTYIRDLAQDTDRNLYLTLAAYNNGPFAMKRWLRKTDEAVLDDALVMVESYPVGETRLFIKKVMANMWIYDQILNNRQSGSLEKLAQQF